MMKTLFALVVTSSSIAAAGPRVATLAAPSDDTADTAPAVKAVARPEAYVSAGGAIGIGGGVDWLYGAESVDAGYRLTDSFWLRGRFDHVARIGYGAINQSVTLIAPQHPHSDAMLGIEARKCVNEMLCFVGGTDTGFRFGDSEFSNGVIVVPRTGLDIGTRNLRIRPSLEGSIAFARAHDPGEPALADLPTLGLGFTTTVAYQW